MAEGKPAAPTLSVLLRPCPTPLADLPLLPTGPEAQAEGQMQGGPSPSLPKPLFLNLRASEALEAY